MSAETSSIYPGMLLLSEPFMPDPHFKRTVVLICEYNEKDGAVGFILNRSMDMRVCDAMLDMDKVKSDIFYGGPVAQSSMHFLHQFGDIIEDSMHIVDDVYWGGNFEQITEMLKEGLLNPEGIKFILGYSGWSPGQLEEEMAEGSWITAQGKSLYIFGTKEENLWKKVLEDKGGKFKQVVNYPEDPSLN
jgi:putative transcriptional regulator